MAECHSLLYTCFNERFLFQCLRGGCIIPNHSVPLIAAAATCKHSQKKLAKQSFFMSLIITLRLIATPANYSHRLSNVDDTRLGIVR